MPQIGDLCLCGKCDWFEELAELANRFNAEAVQFAFHLRDKVVLARRPMISDLLEEQSSANP